MSRRDAREKVIQALYQLEFHSDDHPFPADWLESLNEQDRQFYHELFSGVRAHRERLEAQIKPRLRGWTWDRLPVLDRAVLRLGVYELMYRDDIPPEVTLNEAVELAKRFSTEQSARYINGVLSQIRRHFDKQDRSQKEQ